MIQGTMSNVGKSVLAAGLCRIFAQDGFSVAPFKSQNMALNSFITADGLEMGRAQVMQAEAAGAEPSVLMNPILLKPTSDVGSQVIVNGEVLGTMSAKEYFAYKTRLIPHIMRAYTQLATEHDIVVIEGAGSPAEINLKENDIVNMGMAERAHAPVLLVGDIDRGGVFAQLVGTVALLTEDERARVKGFIINKFRGDESLLTSGIRMLEEKTGIPVVGTVPYMHITLDDEDSLSEHLHTSAHFEENSEKLQIAVIKLPHISNFTDVTPLQTHSAVNLYYVSSPADVGEPDAIIIPGTKNTISDMHWLTESGLSERIRACVSKNTPIVGICGGFQLLGARISDPFGVESNTKTAVSALGLLPVETTFTPKKTRTRVHGTIALQTGFFAPLSALPVEGYEIHMGETQLITDDAQARTCSIVAEVTDSVSLTHKTEGVSSGTVLGTYLHGFFDSPAITRAFLSLIAQKRAVPLSDDDAPVRTHADFKESQYNLLAQTLREHLDMQKIYALLSLPHAPKETI